MVEFCSKCVMPFWVREISFGRPWLRRSKVRSSGGYLCEACARAEMRKKIDWGARYAELVRLCDKHRKSNGEPDVIVPVSGGKDSHFQVITLLALGMHPLLVVVRDCFGGTDAGRRNLENLENLGCACITWRQNLREMRTLMREAFERYGSPTWPVDAAIYAVPLRVAAEMKIQLIVYGENISWTYGGVDAVDQASARDQMRNGVVRQYELDSLSKEARTMLAPPDDDVVRGLEPVYLSYYIPWSGLRNRDIAARFGFVPSDSYDLWWKDRWERSGFIENYDQIDSLGYCVHPQMKWVKFGCARVSDVASNWVRDGAITRKEAVEMVHDKEGYFDQRAENDFCRVLGYSHAQFEEIVRRHANGHLFTDGKIYGYHALRKDLRVR